MGLSAEVLSQDPLVYSQKLTTQLQTRHDDRHLNTPSTQAKQAEQYGQILFFRSIKMGTWGIFRPPEKA